MQDIKAALERLLGPNVGIGVTDPRDSPSGLWPEEAAALPRAIPKRRAEYAAGRRAARQAMGALGLPAAAILNANDRAPIWPAGLTGSIAHCDDCCIAAVTLTSAHRALGIDLEPAKPLDADLIPTICCQTEQDWVAGQADPGLAAMTIFCAKEAIYKAQYPLTGQVIGYDAVTVHLADGDFAITAHPTLPDMQGAVVIKGGLILAVACA
ncbi:4'-phosphopantetheinyl transferase family protein [Loktanella sp. Alg231-35]|uniref:4'-phosphopantetheinyl transferase family protein n=1 Tax=Loktanella sp. Alg231-35 TaxID=1922220 RepID=UPI000D55A074|nr:4'-phosphopantetheinyl transferase superfamily protein [Loktanella sp. Alg231-35]